MKRQISLRKAVERIRTRLCSYNEPIRETVNFPDNDPKAQIITHFMGAKFLAGRSNKIEAMLLDRGEYDRENLTFCKSVIREGDVCLDVGANIGVYTTLFAKWVGSSGQVHAFEPVDHMRRKLRLNATINHLRNVRISPVALGDSNGYAEMNQIREGHFRGGTSCLIENENVLKIGRDQFTQVQVEMKTVDDYLSQNNVTQVDVVKVDIEGYELKFLKGARRLLVENRPILLMEHIKNRLQFMKIDEREFQEIFQKTGYECFELFSISGANYFIPYRFDRGMRGTNLFCLPV